jgi:hypothetical protein
MAANPNIALPNVKLAYNHEQLKVPIIGGLAARRSRIDLS